MKKIIIPILSLLFLVACSNDPAVNAAFDKYEGEPGIVSISVPGFVIKAALAFTDLEPEEKDLLQGIDKLKILAMEDESNPSSINFYEEFNQLIETNKYTELLAVNNANEQVRILAKMHQEDQINDLLILIGGDDNALIYIKGDFSTQQLAKIANKNHTNLHHLIQFQAH